MKPDATTVEHRIVKVSYGLNVTLCTCGETMTAKDGLAWREHRLAVGLQTPSVSGFFGHRRRG